MAHSSSYSVGKPFLFTFRTIMGGTIQMFCSIIRISQYWKETKYRGGARSGKLARAGALKVLDI